MISLAVGFFVKKNSEISFLTVVLKKSSSKLKNPLNRVPECIILLEQQKNIAYSSCQGLVKKPTSHRKASCAVKKIGRLLFHSPGRPPAHSLLITKCREECIHPARSPHPRPPTFNSHAFIRQRRRRRPRRRGRRLHLWSGYSHNIMTSSNNSKSGGDIKTKPSPASATGATASAVLKKTKRYSQ